MSVVCPANIIVSFTIPVLHYLLSDHLDVFKALHTADVIHQDVGIGIANTSATQVQPLLNERHREKLRYAN